MILFWTSINTQYDDRYFQVNISTVKKKYILLKPQASYPKLDSLQAAVKPPSGCSVHPHILHLCWILLFSWLQSWLGWSKSSDSFLRKKQNNYTLRILKCIYFSSKHSLIITLHRKTSSQNHEDLCLPFSLQSFCWKSQRYPDYSFSICNLFFFMRALKTSFIKVL